MEHQNTIPAPLTPISGPRLPAAPATDLTNGEETPLAMKLVFWVAMGLLAFGAARYFGL